MLGGCPRRTWASPRSRGRRYKTSLACGRGHATMLRISFRFLTRILLGVVLWRVRPDMYLSPLICQTPLNFPAAIQMPTEEGCREIMNVPFSCLCPLFLFVSPFLVCLIHCVMNNAAAAQEVPVNGSASSTRCAAAEHSRVKS